MEFQVSLEPFEGPLDLMLHLIRTHKLDLFALNLDVLASQYVQYLRRVIDKGLDVGSEYLVECASLMEYKSKKLLPRSELETNDDYQEDPAAVLARRLQEYERCKALARSLELLESTRAKKIDRDPSSLIEEWESAGNLALPSSLPLEALEKAIGRVIRRYQILQPYETSVEIKELSIEERMQQIDEMEWIDPDEPFEFDQLCRDVHSLREAVVTFLALLEMVHSGVFAVRFDQEKETIWIQKLMPSV